MAGLALFKRFLYPPALWCPLLVHIIPKPEETNCLSRRYRFHIKLLAKLVVLRTPSNWAVHPHTVTYSLFISPTTNYEMASTNWRLSFFGAIPKTTRKEQGTAEQSVHSLSHTLKMRERTSGQTVKDVESQRTSLDGGSRRTSIETSSSVSSRSSIDMSGSQRSVDNAPTSRASVDKGAVSRRSLEY